ncbi:hypothetical protein L0F63_003375, partial [Massospora cicadina]
RLMMSPLIPRPFRPDEISGSTVPSGQEGMTLKGGASDQLKHLVFASVASSGMVMGFKDYLLSQESRWYPPLALKKDLRQRRLLREVIKGTPHSIFSLLQKSCSHYGLNGVERGEQMGV